MLYFCFAATSRKCHKWSMELFMNNFLTTHPEPTRARPGNFDYVKVETIKAWLKKTCPQNKHPRKITEHHQVLPLFFFGKPSVSFPTKTTSGYTPEN